MEYNSNIIPILTGLGQDPMKFSNVGDYQKGLKKAIADIEAKTKGSGDNRSKILRNEFIRIRKTKIDAKKVFNRGSQTQPDSTKKKTTATATPVGGSNAIVKYIENNEQAIGKLTNIVVSDAEDEKKKQKKKKIQTNRENEQKDAKKEEGALEKFKNVGKKALLGPVKAVGKAVKGTLAKLFDFIKIVVGGWFLDKGMKFMQAWEKGDTETMRKIGMNLIAAVAAVGGVILAMNFGLLALPKLMVMLAASIIKIGGAILAFLVSPAGLIALAIAAGVGAVIVGVNAFKNRDGKAVRAEREAARDELEEAGVTQSVGGNLFNRWNVKRDGKLVARQYKNLTDDEKAAVDKFKLRDGSISDLMKQKEKELNDLDKEFPMPKDKSSMSGSGLGIGGIPTKEESIEMDRIGKLKAERVKAIKEKYDKLVKIKNQSSVKSSSTAETINSDNSKSEKINNIIKDTNLSSLPETKPKVTVVNKGSSATDKTGQNLRQGTTTDVPSIASSDTSNFYTLYSKMNYNVVG